jgi:hypothetical protein
MPIVINLGNNIAPAGTGRTELDLGPYAWDIKNAEFRASRKNQANQGLALTLVVVESSNPAMVGLEVESWTSLPIGEDFSESTKEGKANRARVAEFKAILVGAGFPAEAVAKQMNGQLSFDEGVLKGKRIYGFYEPPIREKGYDYPAITFADAETFGKMKSNQIRPRLKNDPNKGTSTTAQPASAVAGLFGGAVPGASPVAQQQPAVTGAAYGTGVVPNATPAASPPPPTNPSDIMARLGIKPANA